ncbi:MAG: YfcE family phosphodiesterase, partial [Desulfurococcaceae archaeon]
IREVLEGVKVIAVRGNNDGDIYQLTSLFSKYNWIFKQDPSVVEINGKRVFLMHGYGGVDETIGIVKALSKSLEVDVILFGHTHKYFIDRSNGRLILNPGEICGYLTNKVTYALIDLDLLNGEIILA